MAGLYKRGKLLLDSFHTFSSRVSSQNSRIFISRYFNSKKLGSTKGCFQQNSTTNLRIIYNVYRCVFVVLVVGSGVLITVKYGNLQNVPYTKQKHLLLWSNARDRMAGDSSFENKKLDFKEDLLPEIHPESVRVRMIANRIFDALKRDLSKKNMWRDDLGKSRKKANQRQSHQPCTSHLDGLNWGILVVNDNTIANAYSYPNGKVMVFTGLLELLTSDDLATLIAHEVGHTVARHAAEGQTNYMFFIIQQLILLPFVSFPSLIVNLIAARSISLLFSRRQEIEADYIRLLLLASAGYDPRVAPKVYEKFGKIFGDSFLNYFSTHPSGQKRAKLLSQDEVMKEAVTIYENARAGHEK